MLTIEHGKNHLFCAGSSCIETGAYPDKIYFS